MATTSTADTKEIGQVTAHVDDVEANSNHDKQAISPVIEVVPKRSWRSYIWDTFDKSPEERRLVFKLDCALLTIGCLGYFVKFLDQVNVNNAFVVSGPPSRKWSSFLAATIGHQTDMNHRAA
jgi:PhoPQ-activated pathogenicity-related protein